MPKNPQKAAEAVELASESARKLNDAVSQTAAIAKRINAEATGTMNRKQLEDLAKRIWETRPEFASAAKALAQLSQTRYDQHFQLVIKNNGDKRITALRAQIESQSLTSFSDPSSVTSPPLGPPTNPHLVTPPNNPYPDNPLLGNPPLVNTPPANLPTPQPDNPLLGNPPLVNSLPPATQPPPDQRELPPMTNANDRNWWGCKGDICDSYYNEGDRAFDNQYAPDAAAAKAQFYEDNPQLTQQLAGQKRSIQQIAAEYPPSDEIDEAVQKGQLRTSDIPSGGPCGPNLSGSSVCPDNPSAADFTNLLEKARSLNQTVDNERDNLHNQLGDLNRQMTNLDTEFTSAQISAREQPAASSPAVPPGWWVKCTCPADHPTAGILVGTTRWHSPLILCPK